MPLICDADCGREAEPSFYVELEYPVSGEDGAGRITGQLCGRCAERVARSPPVGRLITHSDAPDPSAGRVAAQRAADALCMVGLAIEAVDLNALEEGDVRTLLDAKATISELTLAKRRTGNALERGG